MIKFERDIMVRHTVDVFVAGGSYCRKMGTFCVYCGNISAELL